VDVKRDTCHILLYTHTLKPNIMASSLKELKISILTKKPKEEDLKKSISLIVKSIKLTISSKVSGNKIYSSLIKKLIMSSNLNSCRIKSIGWMRLSGKTICKGPVCIWRTESTFGEELIPLNSFMSSTMILMW